MSQDISTSKDWRKSYWTDRLSALNSLRSKEDFSGRAALYASQTDLQPMEIDLLVQNVNFVLAEHMQITQHIGDTFGAMPFGKAPMEATISAVLADTQQTFGKQYLIDAYKNKLRLSAVARTGKIPVLRCENTILRGPFTALRITEASTSEDTVIVVLTMLVMSYSLIKNRSTIVFDYVHGTESVEVSADTSEGTEADGEVGIIKNADMPILV